MHDEAKTSSWFQGLRLWRLGERAIKRTRRLPNGKRQTTRRGLDEVPLRGTSIPYPSKAFFMKRDLRADALSAWWAAQFSLARDRTAHVQRPVAQQNGALKRRVSCPQAFQRRETIRVPAVSRFFACCSGFCTFLAHTSHSLHRCTNPHGPISAVPGRLPGRTSHPPPHALRLSGQRRTDLRHQLR